MGESPDFTKIAQPANPQNQSPLFATPLAEISETNDFAESNTDSETPPLLPPTQTQQPPNIETNNYVDQTEPESDGNNYDDSSSDGLHETIPVKTNLTPEQQLKNLRSRETVSRDKKPQAHLTAKPTLISSQNKPQSPKLPDIVVVARLATRSFSSTDLSTNQDRITLPTILPPESFSSRIAKNTPNPNQTPSSTPKVALWRPEEFRESNQNTDFRLERYAHIAKYGGIIVLTGVVMAVAKETLFSTLFSQKPQTTLEPVNFKAPTQPNTQNMLTLQAKHVEVFPKNTITNTDLANFGGSAIWWSVVIGIAFAGAKIAELLLGNAKNNLNASFAMNGGGDFGLIPMPVAMAMPSKTSPENNLGTSLNTSSTGSASFSRTNQINTPEERPNRNKFNDQVLVKFETIMNTIDTSLASLAKMINQRSEASGSARNPVVDAAHNFKKLKIT